MKRNRKLMLLVSVWAALMLGIFLFLNAAETGLYMNGSSHTITSVGWAGYIVSSSFNNQESFVGIEATWVVPEVNASGGEGYSSAWIGIGGQTDKTLIQVGTEHNLYRGKPLYDVWYEVLPDYAIRMPQVSVTAGDTVKASLQLINNQTSTWNIQLVDLTNGQMFSKQVTYNSSRSSGEWIVERPLVNEEISRLADFGAVTFSQCTMSLEVKQGVLGNFSYSVVHMTNEALDTLASALPLNSQGTSFTVNYLKAS